MDERARDQIVRIPMGTSNAYLVVKGPNAILIDAGNRRKEQKVVDALQKMDLSPSAIQLIILTHSHYDHCGSLKTLKDITDAKILIHRSEAECLRQGVCAIPEGTRWFSKIITSLGRILARQGVHYPPVLPDITIHETFELRRFGINGYILPTPGHTSGSISVILRDTHAVVGDTLFHVFRNRVFPPFADDPQELVRSWRKLIDMGCAHFYPGHGKPFGRELLRKAYEARRKPDGVK